MEILSRQRPQIVSGDFSTNFHPFWPCDCSLESSNPTLFDHMGTSHFNTSYSICSCSFLSKIFLLILTGSIASKGIVHTILVVCTIIRPPWEGSHFSLDRSFMSLEKLQQMFKKVSERKGCARPGHHREYHLC